MDRSLFSDNAKRVVNALQNFLDASIKSSEKVINQELMHQILNDLDIESLVKNGNLSDNKLQKFTEKYLSYCTRLHQPEYMGHQVAIPHATGSLGSLIDGFTNNAMAIYEMGPAASSIEYFMINWMLEKIGWKPSPLQKSDFKRAEIYGGGVLMHGGSLANLTAILAARSAVSPETWNEGNGGKLAIMAPAESHYSIARAAGITGIGQNSLYQLPVDKRGAIIPGKIPEIYKQLKNDGKIPVALVANACSTAVGIYDPIDEIADFCNKNNIWMHIDGAHGASLLLSKKHKHLLKGIEKADSVTWDAHKMLRTPTLCAALLVKNYIHLDTAFQQDASYLFHDKDQPGFDFLHRTIECTKSGLGLKLFMSVAAMGENGLEEYLDRQVKTGMIAYQILTKEAGFNCPVKPEFNIVCFRVDGSDELQLQIRNELIRDGRFYISSTVFKGKRYLRLALMNPITSEKEIRALSKEILKIRQKLIE